MLGSKRASWETGAPSPARAKDPVQLLTVKGAHARIEGKFEIRDAIEVECEIGGEMKVDGRLIIGENGVVQADVRTVDAIIRGTYEGSMVATGCVEIAPSGRVLGNIQTDSLIIHQGGKFNGNVSRMDRDPKSAVQLVEDRPYADKDAARARALELLRRVGIPNAEQRLDAYSFQLSGGMCQRVMIAIALACEPSVLIADEPTTALDVTTQARIIDLIRDLQADTGMSVVFITHDLGVVAEIADEVVVMYLGTVVERGSVRDVFHDPKHPYTQALLASIPRMGAGTKQRLAAIRGNVPHPSDRPDGCPFHPRCDDAIPGRCDQAEPPTVQLGDDRLARCVLYDAADPAVTAASTQGVTT
jgi:oligopeptide/dipeptide ABC transporter ATP-binding protein